MAFFLNINKKFNKNIAGVSANVQKMFMDYPWPGNVRELEHTLEHAFVLCSQPIITFDCLPSDFKEGAGSFEERVDSAEEIIQALEKTLWNKAKAARVLGVSRRTLYRKIKDYNIMQDEK